MSTSRRQIVGIICHTQLAEANDLAHELKRRYASGSKWWIAYEDALERFQSRCDDSDLLITIGGDGTILRGIHEAARRKIPVLGLNMGRVGFMAEIDACEAIDGIGWYLDGNAHIERRSMLRADVPVATNEGIRRPYDALNDVVVARGSGIRVVEVDTILNGTRISTYRGDGVVVSTATGSTGYCLSLGGPVMDPESDNILLKPIAAHMSLQGGVILRPQSKLELALNSENPCTVSIDGCIDLGLVQGQTVKIQRSPHDALFLRKYSTSAFWGSVTRRLGMRHGAVQRQPPEQ